MELPISRRHRRLRRSAGIRGLIRETELTPAHLVYPLFIEAGLSGRKPIDAMPGQDRLGMAVRQALAGTPCTALIDGPQIVTEEISAIPDVVVTCSAIDLSTP